jgi:hypothetical protein
VVVLVVVRFFGCDEENFQHLLSPFIPSPSSNEDDDDDEEE